MGSGTSSQLLEEEIQDISKETGFNRKQIMRLYSRFTSLDKTGNGTLMKEDFMRIPELAINPLASRIIFLFFDRSEEGNADSSGAEGVNFRQFMRTLARFRQLKPRGANIMNSRREKLKYAFKMYDIDKDNKISRSELLDVLHMMVGANISEEQLGSIADRTIMEADEDQDGFIQFEEFCKVMEKVDVETKMSIRFMN